MSDAIKPRGHAVNASAEVQAFRWDQRSFGVSIAAVEGAALISGHDPIARKDFVLTVTRHYVTRQPAIEDGFPLEADDFDTKE